MPRRRAATSALLAAAGAAAAAALCGAAAPPSPAFHPSPTAAALAGDRLRFAVTGTGDPALDGTYALRCHPAAGDRARPAAACAALDTATATAGSAARGPFAPVPARSVCTRIYGGPAAAHVTGTWRGTAVDAWFRRTDGCEIARWDALVPALPRVR